MVDIRGPIGAPAIIFVHGACISRKLWLPQMDSLAETYRTLASDLPGHDGKRTKGS
ncbi:alpha/beta fold hydrolase [Haloferax sp. YSSS75]|uniref:alpha/beta fold hydrolase n=1 Tax=Haloferax sp. YSSS75 TaxID=3388564 RepID=UPI00398CDFA4